MHDNAYKLVKTFIGGELAASGMTSGDLLEVGSLIVNGSYKPLFPNFAYFGVDIREGPGVDLVVPQDKEWDLERKFDVVICGQTLEHVARPWVLMKIIGSHMKEGALLYLAAPFCWPRHSHPRDYQRFSADGLHVMVMEAGCKPLRQEQHNAKMGKGKEWYEECVAVGRKTAKV